MGRITARASLALFAFGMFGAAIWAALSVDGAHATTNCDTSTAANDGAELTMLQLVNAARAAQGAHPLVLSPNLNRMAAWKSEDSSAVPPAFDHVDSLGRSPFERATDCGYASGAAENIAYGYSSAQATFDAWMQSAGHKANILNPGYVAIGIGHSGNAWTMNFGFVDDSGAPPPPPPTSPPTNTPTPTKQATIQPSPTATAIPFPARTQPPPPAQTQPPPPALHTNPAQPTATATPRPIASNPAPTGHQLTSGLNLVTYNGPPMAVEMALGALGSNVSWVYTWDGEHWLRYFPGSPPYVNSLTTLRSGVAYFVQMTGSATWAY